MSTVKNLKSKVLNTLNILSGQDITKTKLYQSILTASDKEKENIIIYSSRLGITFARYGMSLETTNIYKWLEIIFDRFKKEEGIDVKNLWYDDRIAYNVVNLSHEEFKRSFHEIKKLRRNPLLAYDYAEAWAMYACKNESNSKKVAKIIQPLELFIVTAITIMVIGCHINQRPFKIYADMDLISILQILEFGYYPNLSTVVNGFLETSYQDIKQNKNIQYTVLDLITSKDEYEEPISCVIMHSLNGRFTDEAFGKIIQVSEKSDYEKLKALYKK